MALRDRYAVVVGALPRVPALGHLEEARAALAALAVNAGKLLVAHQESLESSGTTAQSERHNHNSNPDTTAFEPVFGMVMKISDMPGRDETSPMGGGGTRSSYPLGLVLDACPDVADFASEGIRSWRDLADTAEKIRPMLGISPDAWREACQVMGDAAAAVTVAAILQRAEHIKSPGGYLRALVERKRRGEFSLGPVLQALMRAQLQTFPGQPRGWHAVNRGS